MKDEEIRTQQPVTLPAEHLGMPALDPQGQRALMKRQVTRHDASVEVSLHLPHERDQSTAMTATGRSPLIERAFVDEQRGLEDTSKEPEMLDAYSKQTPASPSDVLLHAVRAAGRHRSYFSPAVAVRLGGTRPEQWTGESGLTPREMQVLLRLAEGESTGLIANALRVSSVTVSCQRAALFQKLDVQSNSALTRYALSKGLIE